MNVEIEQKWIFLKEETKMIPTTRFWSHSIDSVSDLGPLPDSSIQQNRKKGINSSIIQCKEG